LLQLVDGAQELLVLGQADAFDITLAVLGILGEALDEGADPTAGGGIFEDGDQLVEEVGVGRREDDLRQVVWRLATWNGMGLGGGEARAAVLVAVQQPTTPTLNHPRGLGQTNLGDSRVIVVPRLGFPRHFGSQASRCLGLLVNGFYL
jgi:hypothetical protein